VAPLVAQLYIAGADVILSAHEHNYERFAPQTPDGKVDRAAGLTQFVVGTGGKSLPPSGEPMPTVLPRRTRPTASSR
jgi:hypothetical protein